MGRMNLRQKIKKLEHQKLIGILIILVLTVVGVRLLTLSRAESPYASVEAEAGTLGGIASVQSDTNASGGKDVLFGFPSTTALTIHVNGTKLINGQGSQIRLLGTDASGPEYCSYDGSVGGGNPLNSAEAEDIASWKMNAVRIPLNEDCWLGLNGISINGESTVASAQTYQSTIESWVTDLNNDGIYVILDLHWSAPGTNVANVYPMADEDHSPAFWTSVATAFKSNPAVIFDLFNEPYIGNSDAPTSTAPWTCWLNGCTVTDEDYSPSIVYTSAGIQQLVNVVRATGATQPIELGGVNYSSDPCGLYEKYESTAACPETANMPTDPSKQLIISYHNYINPNCTTQSCWNTHWADELTPITSAGYPMVTDELGEDDCADTFMNWYMSWADTNSESYLAWSWVPTLYSSTCSTGSNQNYSLIADWNGDPSTIIPQGADFKSHLAAVSPY
jgi:hypothetical protein